MDRTSTEKSHNSHFILARPCFFIWDVGCEPRFPKFSTDALGNARSEGWRGAGLDCGCSVYTKSKNPQTNSEVTLRCQHPHKTEIPLLRRMTRLPCAISIRRAGLGDGSESKVPSQAQTRVLDPRKEAEHGGTSL